MSGTKIINCNCKHDFMDKMYGRGKRVANNKKAAGARCTVCGKSTDDVVVKKK